MSARVRVHVMPNRNSVFRWNLISFSIPSEHSNRRQFSKNESLLVSLLKQEAIGEKKQDMQSNRTSAAPKTTNQKLDDDDDTVYDSSTVELKLEKEDPDFVMKKQKNAKKTSSKNQVFLSVHRLPPFPVFLMKNRQFHVDKQSDHLSTSFHISFGFPMLY